MVQLVEYLPSIPKVLGSISKIDLPLWVCGFLLKEAYAAPSCPAETTNHREALQHSGTVAMDSKSPYLSWLLLSKRDISYSPPHKTHTTSGHL
jgi:hypothetical protein